MSKTAKPEPIRSIVIAVDGTAASGKAPISGAATR